MTPGLWSAIIASSILLVFLLIFELVWTINYNLKKYKACNKKTESKRQ